MAGVYAALALVNDPAGTLGTDTGAKVATLEAMAEDRTLEPVVPYWAEEHDPAGDYHPLFDTRRNDEGRWVNVTTLPMLVAARPLYELGGYRLALLIPALGALAAAFAGRDIARQLAGPEAGMRALWIIGLASPVAVYALDLWEHAPGAALMVWGVAGLLRVVRGRPAVPASLLAGAAFGAAATMRSEALALGFAATAVTCLFILRRSVVSSLAAGASGLVGFAVPWLANAALESAAGANRRSQRVTGRLDTDPASELGERLREGLITTFGTPLGPGIGRAVIAGVLFAGALAFAVRFDRRGEAAAARLTLAAGLVVMAMVVLDGPAFVPGALVASPVAVAAVGLRMSRDRACVLCCVAVAVPLVVAFQYLGGALPQWGGRYLLAPTLLLTTLGAVALGNLGRTVRTGVVVCAGLVTVSGFAFLVQRTHQIAELFDALEDRPEDVVISTNGFLVREAGADWDERLYLSVGRRGTLPGAVDVARAAGARTIGVVTTRRRPPVLPGAAHLGTDAVDFLGVDQHVHSYRL